MGKELSKVYEPKTVERQVNELWFSKPYFHADASAEDEKNYTIVIPPPNVTAPLHLGHALNNTLQDILIRFRRMQNFNTLWMPGTDHAGIATQTVVEKRILAEEGKRRTDFKREDFVARVQAWKDEYEAKIIEQLRAMGCSCDWQRTRFTMDETCAKAVRAAFFKLFKDGLIYRGKRLVNWDPATQTVLADDEVEHETVQGHFWYLRYPLVESVKIPSEARPGWPCHNSSGTGFQPVDYAYKRNGAYLPHWTQTEATYAVTFCLADSLPADVLEQWRMERDRIVHNAESQGRELTLHEQQELARLYCDKVESYLNAGHGQCYLREPKIAELASDALKHFDGERYDLIAWAVMPNHVHTVIKPYEGIELSDILHSWKSYTANKANELLGRTGAFWQSEYYDHLIRDQEDFVRQVNYVLSNPTKANLGNWPWAGAKIDSHGQDAHATDNYDTAKMAVPLTIEYVTVATTRPETMLGDTAVAMNPADPRAKYLVGKNIRLPIVGRIIPIIADEHVVLPNPNKENNNHGQDARATDEKAKFSTGFLKVTPAHDPDDWAIGQRHGLEIINIMAPDGSISDKYGWEDADSPEAQGLLGMDRFEAREAIVEWFRQENLLEEVREYAHEVGHSYRSHVPIEPYLSDQWYIAVKKPIKQSGTGFQPVNAHIAHKDTAKMAVPQNLIEGTDVPTNSLAGLALKPLLDGKLRFIPERYAKTYQTWLENLRDWPISRQLWWGHRIPIWSRTIQLEDKNKNWIKAFYNLGIDHMLDSEWAGRIIVHVIDTETGQVIENPNDEFNRKDKGKYTIYLCPLSEKDTDKPGNWEKAGFERDTDVLDTWFSSALWPFSTLGWPAETPELEAFYPGDVLCTAREIITLWVSRMVMMGQYCVGDIPFSTVYIHAMIQDGEGRKMSKSLGNGIDPLVAIDSHGADAMRFTLASMTTETQDIRMPVASMTLPDGRTANTSPKFDTGRNFCNKLWNASRFTMMNLEGIEPEKFDKNKMALEDKWILSRLAQTVSETTASLDEFKFSEPLAQLYKFFWNDLCDWYLEWIKPRMRDESQKATAQNVLAFVFDQTLRLLHPFVPFITEGIFQKLNEVAPARKLKGLIQTKKSDALVIGEWPHGLDSFVDKDAESQVAILQEAIRGIRDLRMKYNKQPAEKLEASVNAPKELAAVLNGNCELIRQLAGLKKFSASEKSEKLKDAAAIIAGQMQIYLHNAVDVQAERQRLEKQKQQIEQGKKSLEAKLANENFVSKARPEVVAQSKEKLKELVEQLAAVEKHLSQLGD